MIESVRGEEAASLFMSHEGLPARRRGIGFLKDLALRFSKLPYENISKIIKSAESAGPYESMRLPSEVVIDHMERNFGGTCFSLTFLLERMLRALGFACYKVMADMNSGRNVHCLVVVEEGRSKYMIDPGYALYEVIELPQEGTSRAVCPHAVVEIVAIGAHKYSLWTKDRAGRKWRYTFLDQAAREEDFERHWVASFSKPTLNNICLTRMTRQGHLYFRKDFFKFTSLETINKRRLKHDAERFIEETFGIGSEWAERAQKLLAEKRGNTWGR